MIRMAAFLFLSTGSFSAFGQMPGASGATPLARTETHFGTAAQDMIYERGILSVKNISYVINGVKVLGSPFLYHDWYNGTIITADGRLINGYKLRYDTYNQALLFSNGKDSLEVNEPIKEFTLIAPDENKSLKTFTFINADQFQKSKKPLFYELLLDKTSGQLLKLNQKAITESRNLIATTFENNKAFNLVTSFYYFNKDTKKITAIKANGSNISEMLNLTTDQKKTLSNYDFTREASILDFFNSL